MPAPTRTLDALTGVLLYSLGYDSSGQLASFTDQDGLVSSVDPAGKAGADVSDSQARSR